MSMSIKTGSMNWFMKPSSNEAVDLVEQEVEAEITDGDTTDGEVKESETSGSDSSSNDTNSRSGGLKEIDEGKIDEEEEDEEEEEEEDDGLSATDLREDVDAANYEIGVLRQRLTKRIEALEKLQADREREQSERNTASEAARVSEQNASATLMTLQAQAALRLELSRAQWDAIDREFAVETRRIFIGWLRATGNAPSDHHALRAVVRAMSFVNRGS